ncbi:dehydrogenase/reductase SDR family member 7-like isoform X2 [Belonocnema kinseyi]|uniref:dehydrogenase/reductase SDR family member 7-like isoform X2 n=1 Tax=Belonocnema kinseyi TaxID=2817044 RepID=UPI00143D50A0|nr:dehydrogenase/reductase SDR family member 7-like isoform X2 [Belonocnema kinseyi]
MKDFIYSLRNQVVWIVGASSGIGENLAYSLADAGCKLILSARRTDLLEKVKTNCLRGNVKLTEKDILVLPFNICDAEVHQKMLNTALSEFGQLDILVNNAGRTQRAIWEKIDLKVDKELFHLNVFSIISLSRVVLKYFLEKGKGHFAVTSSTAGFTGVPFSASYTGSKHALHGYFESMRTEKATNNIAITMICPGPIQTDFLYESFTENPGEKLEQKTAVSSTKVSAKRCGQLISIGLANQLEEIWIANPIVILLCYLKYYPNLNNIIWRHLGPRFFQKVRDSKDIVKT